MTYQVTFTESSNPAKPSIAVQDQTLNNQTSLTFVGKNYSGYAPVIANNFLHLLENFASNTAPSNPVEGQLWYDNTASVNLLKVYDGTQWTAAGSIKKSGQPPVISNSNPGDLWVDTVTAQLYVFSGSNWLLVGPQYSSGVLTGPVVDVIVDTSNISHSVISLYANDSRLAIISKEAFTPKSTVTGFATINQGFNLSSVDTESTTATNRIWGTARQADALLVNGNRISAENFLTTDGTTTVSNYALSVRADGGLTVGSGLSFNIGTDASSTILFSKASGNAINFRLTNPSNIPVTVLYVDSLAKVGIGSNNTNPATTLDVAGVITSLGLDVITTTDSTSSTTGSINTTGGLGVALNSNFGGNITVNGQININTVDSNGDPIIGPTILPTTSGVFDIGSDTKSFRNIYAESFVGNFTGQFTGTLEGSISGSAARLASPTVFSLAGDVSSDPLSFTGQTQYGTAVFNTTISQNFISNKTLVSDSLFSDQLLIYRPGSTNLYRTTKQSFLQHVPVVPVGAIFPYAGSTPPSGYLFCDGSEVSTGDYPQLYAVIGYTYKAVSLLIGSSTFALPDLRGRFPLGRDSMNNGIDVPSRDDIGVLVNGQPELAANRVADITADIVGTGAGSQNVTLGVTNLPDHKHNLSSANAQYYAAGLPGGVSDVAAVPGLGLPSSSTGSGLPNSGSVIAGTLGQPFNVMNPYATINYIIFTGVL